MLHYGPMTDVEKAFYLSWLLTVNYFASLVIIYSQPSLIPFFRLLHSLEFLRHSNKLRFGSSAEILILSRSRESELRPEQPKIHIAIENETFIVRYFDGTSTDEIHIEIPKEKYVWRIETC